MGNSSTDTPINNLSSVGLAPGGNASITCLADPVSFPISGGIGDFI